MKIQKRLFELQDNKYADFQSGLIPGLPRESFIGVRVPEIRKLAKEYEMDPEHLEFMRELPHRYYDENLLHGALICRIREYDACIRALEQFLPYVDNWAVCDLMSPKVFQKNREKLMEKIREWTLSERTYTCRFGIGMLMSHFLDEDFRPEYLEIPASVHSGEYYINMMIAWYYATALAKQWEAAIPYLQEKRLEVWVHNKTIQKARESRRISKEQKDYLSSLKRN